MKKSVVLRLRWSSIIHLHRLLLIITDGGAGRLFLTFPLTLGGHTTMVTIGLITMGIVLMVIVVDGITDRSGFKASPWTPSLCWTETSNPRNIPYIPAAGRPSPP